MPKAIPDTPLFVKTHDFLLWLIRHTQRFPKNLRHSYTLKLENIVFEFQESILMANAVRGADRSRWLGQADGKLGCLRALLRFAYDLQLLAGNQVQYAAGLVDELGRLLGAWRDGINASGQVTGWSYTTTGTMHAFLYSGGVMTDLNTLIDPTSGWVLQTAQAINDSGQITGYGIIGGQTHAFLLTPIPEPSSVVLAALGFAGFIAWGWRRRLIRELAGRLGRE